MSVQTNTPAHHAASTYAHHVPILDGGCSDSSYRESDIKHLPSPVTSNPPLCITAATGDRIHSVGTTSRSFNETETHPINIFKDSDLALSLHSLADFTNNDNSCLFTKYGFKVTNPQNVIICQGSKHPDARLWPMPPIDQNIVTYKVPSSDPNFNDYRSWSALFIKNEIDAEFVQHSSSCFGNPPDSTLYRACSKGWLSNYPRLTPKMIHQNRPNSIMTQKGHLNRLRKGLRPTNIYSVLEIEDTEEMAVDSAPEDDQNTDSEAESIDIFASLLDARPIYSKVVDVSKLTPEEMKLYSLHSDAAGEFPFESYEGNKYILVSVFLNYIHVEPLQDRSAPSYIKAYRAIVDFYKSFGFPISLLRLDNESSEALENYFKTEARIPFQYISPHNKRANKAERAIQSFKNHLIASVASANPDFPNALWDKLLFQLELTLAHLRPFALDPDISSYEGLFGKKFDFIAHPIAPVGTKVLIYVPPDLRASWENHGLEGFYLRPSADHYRNVHCFVPSTGGYRDSDQVAYFPDKYTMPGGSVEEILIDAANELKATIANNSPSDDIKLVATKLADAIKTIGTTRKNKRVRPTVTFAPQPLIVTGTSTPDALTQDESAFLDDVIESNRAAPAPADFFPQRRPRKRKPAKDPYRLLLPSELKSASARAYTAKIGQHFKDKASSEEFVIDSIVLPTKNSGRGSKTHFYKMFDTNQYNHPTRSRTFEYTPCAEISKAKYVQWLPRGTSSIAASILSDTPRDLLRNPNQTYEGITLNFKRAKELDPELWLECDIEEYHRLFESGTLLPIYYNQIPDSERRNVAYYNQQVKEKIRLIDDQEYIEARVRGTFGGNIFRYEGPVSTNTAAYSTVKLLFNSTLSDNMLKDKNIRFASIDLVDHYLSTPLETPAYMRIPIKHVPAEIVAEYNLEGFVHNDHVFFKVLKAMYGHPAAGRLANALLINTLKAGDYYEDKLTPCLFHHKTRPTKFALVVDDFGIKYSSNDDLDHLINCISSVWKVKVDLSGSKFLGMNLSWDYDSPVPNLTIDAPNVIPAAIKRFCHGKRPKYARSPTCIKLPRYDDIPIGSIIRQPTPCPDSTKFVQEVCGTFTHYARVIDYSMITAVNNISQSQSNPTSDTLDQIDRLLGYAAKHPDNKIVYYACDMQLRAMYDASFQSLPDGRSRIGHIQYLTNNIDPNDHVQNIIHANSQVLRMRPAHIVEAEYGSAYECGQQTYPTINTLESLGHHQDPTKFFGDNEITIGISNGEVKQKRTRGIEKSYHWFKDKCEIGEFVSIHIPGDLNVSDYFTKDLSVARHDQLIDRIIYVPRS